MATTNGNKKLLDLKRWEWVSPSITASAAGRFFISSRHFRQQQLFLTSYTGALMYYPDEDGWVQLPSPGLAGTTFGAATSGVASCFSTGTTVAASSLTATGTGTSTTLLTNQSLARDLRGYKVHILSGPGAGDVRTIASNTIGTNAVITVTSPFSGTPTASTTYRLITPVFFVGSNGSTGSGSFRKYCFATNTWTTLAVLPASMTSDARMVSTPGFIDNDFVSFATGTATSGTATTIVNSAKTWTTNQWVNYQVRITAGTGAGQIRTITANDATSLTVATWTTTPDATSQYSIEGNDDFIYLMGNAAVTMYRYSISANTWTTLSPVAARSGAPGVALSGHWVWGATDSAWTNESSIINGRRLYSFRGGATSTLDYYDIPSNTWVSGVTYSPAVDTFTTGTSYVYNGDYLYIQRNATGYWYRYNFVTSEMQGWTQLTYSQSTAVEGDKAFDATYTDGATKITYIYFMLNTSSVMLRQMVI